VIGFSGLSAATLLCNLPLYVAWEKRKQNAGKIILAAVVTGFMLLNVGGLWLKNKLPQPDASFKTLLIQAYIENAEKLAAELGKGFSDEIFNRYTTLTDNALSAHKDAKIDFAMWPETAFPALLGERFQSDDYPVALRSFSMSGNAADYRRLQCR
jgi:apolipoprotein N-acyltransferase